jgi:predicted transcriptional regulator
VNHDDDEGRSKRWPTALDVATLTHMVAITIQLPEASLESAKLLAKSAGRALDEVVQELMVDAIEHETRVLAGIKRGLADMEAGRVVDLAHFDARLDEVLRKRSG